MGNVGELGYMGWTGINPLTPNCPNCPYCPLLHSLLIIPISPISKISLLSILSRSIHLLLNSSFLLEVTFLPLNKPSDKHVALMYQCDGDIGDSLIGTFLYLLTIYSRIKVNFAKGTSRVK